jgi:hypothetical protein
MVEFQLTLLYFLVNQQLANVQQLKFDQTQCL